MSSSRDEYNGDRRSDSRHNEGDRWQGGPRADYERWEEGTDSRRRRRSSRSRSRSSDRYRRRERSRSAERHHRDRDYRDRDYRESSRRGDENGRGGPRDGECGAASSTGRAPSTDSGANSIKAKPTSGIFSYLNLPTQPFSGSAAGPAASGEAATSSATSVASSSLRVNTGALERILLDDKRSGDSADVRRETAAARKLGDVGSSRPYGVEPPKSSSVGYGARGDRPSQGDWPKYSSRDSASLEALHLRTAKAAPRDGTTLRDSNSRGIKADVATAKDLPYLCDVCTSNGNSRSFLTATQLSDHLKQRHDVIKHPSLIRPTKKKGAAASTGEEDLNL